MATYKEILGTAVQNFAGDPANPITGQVWYNTVTGVFKYQNEIISGAWATGGNLNTARYVLAGAGIQTSALAFGGSTGPNAGVTNTESYNGTNWTSVNSLNTARGSLAGCGATNTAALAFGGDTQPQTGGPLSAATETWNGTNWTSVNSMNTARTSLGGAGIQTAALGFGGFTTADTNATEEYTDPTFLTKTITTS